MIGNSIAGFLGVGGGAAATSSFESIATVNGNGSAPTLTFSSIVGTYTHLQIRGIALGLGVDNLQMRFNSDTGTNYAQHRLQGNGVTASANGSATQSLIGFIGYETGTTSVGGASIIDIQDYASTSKYKTVRSLNGYDTNGAGNIILASGLWQSTSAITSISIINSGGTAFNASTTFALYGIKG